MANSTLTVAQMEQALVDSKELHEAKTTAEIVAGVDNGNSAKTVTDSLPSATDVTSATAYANTFLEEVAPPTGFNTPALLSSLKAQKVGSEFSCNIKPSDLVDVSTWVNYYYVDSSRPDNAGDGRSWAAAKNSIQEALTLATADALPTRIFIAGGSYGRFKSIASSNTPKTIAAPISFEAVNGRVETGPFEELTWSQNATYSQVYEVARSVVQQVFNTTLKDEYGNSLRYKQVNSILECSQQAGSFFTDNTTLYIQTHNQAPADDINARVFLDARSASLSGNYDLYFYGIDFQGGDEGCIHIYDGSTNKVVADSCSFKYAANGTAATAITGVDGCQIRGCGLFAAFNSESSFNSKDGFNIHDQGIVKPASLIVNSKGYNNGREYGVSQSCNGYTVHDGCVGVEVGCEWLGSVGTNSGHVNDGTQVWSYGCVAGNSDGDGLNGGSITWGAFGVWSGDAKIWLEHCIDVGSRVGVYSETQDNAKYRNHSGTGIKFRALEFTR